MLNFNSQKTVQGAQIFYREFMTEASDKIMELSGVAVHKNNIIHIEENIDTIFRLGVDKQGEISGLHLNHCWAGIEWSIKTML